MKIAVLTSSRADYGIYLPLLCAMKEDSFFDLRIIAFGTHLSSLHGHTIDTIKKDGFTIDHELDHILPSDTEEAIASSMSIAFEKFVKVWQKEKKNYDLVLCLGDRYEMFAAVSAASPFGIKFAHLHGGETTLGAIDNEFRHCITIFSTLHFTSTEKYAERVAAIKGSTENVYCVGALSLDNLKQAKLLSREQFQEKFSIDLSKSSILVTFHPQTVNTQPNKKNAEELIKALGEIETYQIIITMPNADTMGNTMREVYKKFASENNNVVLVENFGTEGYFNCMNLCAMVVGNSSSGIIEAASFKKYVVDIGNRQCGRAVSANVIHCEAEANEILQACSKALKKGEYQGDNIYYKPNVAQNIIQTLRKWYC